MDQYAQWTNQRDEREPLKAATFTAPCVAEWKFHADSVSSFEVFSRLYEWIGHMSLC